jgi:hypothetical protein
MNAFDDSEFDYRRPHRAALGDHFDPFADDGDGSDFRTGTLPELQDDPDDDDDDDDLEDDG